MNDSTRGRHLIVTGYVAPQGTTLLDDPERLAALLTDVVSVAKMNVLDPPRMVRVPLDPNKADGQEDCGGVTGTVILSTSHASIHTWPLHQRVSFDLYSCHDFDAAGVVDLLCGKLLLTGAQIVNIDRTPDPDLRSRFRTINV